MICSSREFCQKDDVLEGRSLTLGANVKPQCTLSITFTSGSVLGLASVKWVLDHASTLSIFQTCINTEYACIVAKSHIRLSSGVDIGNQDAASYNDECRGIIEEKRHPEIR